MEFIKLAICFSAGVYLSERVSASFAVIFFISLILVLTIRAFFKHTFSINILATAIFLILGIIETQIVSDPSCSALSEYEGKYVCLLCRVSEIPAASHGNTRCIATVAELTYNGETKKIGEKLLVTSSTAVRYGETVYMSGIIKPQRAKMNEYDFDYAKYLKGKGIFFKMYCDDVTAAERRIRDLSPHALSNSLKLFIINTIDKRWDGDYAAILKAVLTGYKKDFSPEFKRVLDRTGLARFYYPAFLHISLLISIMTLFQGTLKRQARDFGLILLLIMYAFINSSGSGLRISVMLALCLLTRLIFGRAYFFDMLGLTALMIGIACPLMFFNGGFVLSLLSSVIIHYFFSYADERLYFTSCEYVRRIVVSGLICTVSLIPVTAYFWKNISFASIFIAVIMLPLVSVILILSPVLILMLALFGTAPAVGSAVSAALFLLKLIPKAAEKLPLTLGIYIPQTKFLFFLTYFLIMAAAVKHVKHKYPQRNRALFAAAALCVSAAVIQVGAYRGLDIIFVNVGQGDGAVIKAPLRFNVLIDGGGGSAYSDYDPGEALYLEYLRNEGIKKIDSAFVSHYHKDHAQGIVDVIENLDVRNLFMPDSMEGSEWRVKLEDAAERNGVNVHYLNGETLLRYKNGMTIQAVPPANGARLSGDENDTSYIYYITYSGFTAMFTGDMTSYAERRLLKGGRVPHADLLKVAHHGSRYSSCEEWTRTVDPVYSVISVGENNSNGHPGKETLQNLQRSIIYRTDLDGDIRFTISRNGSVCADTFGRNN